MLISETLIPIINAYTKRKIDLEKKYKDKRGDISYRLHIKLFL